MRCLLEERSAPDRSDRGDVDDASAAAGDEVRPRRLACEEDQVELVADTGVPVVDRQVVPRADHRQRGVVVQHIDAAVRCCGGVDPTFGGLERRQVDRCGRGHDTARVDDQSHGLFRRLRIEIAADDGCALGSEAQRCGAAHANSGAGDQRNLAGES